ncbi:MAG: hypothetical protein LBC41_11370 [Clostridiales bacterium]|nr:hypothetical protein [Clostridiales bacterium]MDR2751251.1 hypothetical protein [Clostridiales bacterium]
MNIVLISGKARHGKDSAAGFIQKRLEEAGKKVLRISFADYVKFVCAKHYGWNGEKDEAGRHILQYVSTEIFRARDPDFWVDTVIRYAKTVWDDYDAALIADWRFPNEYVRWGECGVGTVFRIRVKRPGFDNGLEPEQKWHSSETALEGFPIDMELEADTLDELDLLCQRAIDAFKL